MKERNTGGMSSVVSHTSEPSASHCSHDEIEKDIPGDMVCYLAKVELLNRSYCREK